MQLSLPRHTSCTPAHGYFCSSHETRDTTAVLFSRTRRRCKNITRGKNRIQNSRTWRGVAWRGVAVAAARRRPRWRWRRESGKRYNRWWRGGVAVRRAAGGDRWAGNNTEYYISKDRRRRRHRPSYPIHIARTQALCECSRQETLFVSGIRTFDVLRARRYENVQYNHRGVAHITCATMIINYNIIILYVYRRRCTSSIFIYINARDLRRRHIIMNRRTGIIRYRKYYTFIMSMI